MRVLRLGVFCVPLLSGSVVTFCDRSDGELRSLLDRYYKSLEGEEAEKRVAETVQKNVAEARGEGEDVLMRAKAALEKYHRYRANDVLKSYYEDMKRKGASIPVENPVASSGSTEIIKTKMTAEGKKKPRLPAKDVFSMLPQTGDEICVPYVIIGGGTTAWSAVQAIYARDPNASVLVISEENYPPYNRTPLSKERWNSKDEDLTYIDFTGRRRSLEYSYDPNLASSHRATMMLETKVTQIDPNSRTITTQHGRKVEYKKLLLATGGTARSPETALDDFATAEVADRVLTYRTVDDFKKLDKITRDPATKNITVYGGGFLGAELASSLHRLEKDRHFKTTIAFPEPGLLYKVIPRYLSEYLAHKLRAVGINVLSSTVITGAKRSDENDKDGLITLDTLSFDKESMKTDAVVVAIGIDPRTELAQDAGLEIDPTNGGIVVNGELRADKDIYAAGDVASFWDSVLGRRRVEHWDHALVSGRIAGDNMAGGESHYGLQSMFWCDLSSVGVSFEAVGLLDSKLDSVGVWSLKDPPQFTKFRGSFSRHPFDAGVVWYLKDKRVVGALLWNMPFTALKTARQIIDSKTVVKDDQELKTLLALPETKHPFFMSREDSK